MNLKAILSQYLSTFQQNLFPWLSQELGPLSTKMQRLVAILELVEVEGFLNLHYGLVGRPEKDRGAIARAFVAKAILNMPTTRTLIERLNKTGSCAEFADGKSVVAFRVRRRFPGLLRNLHKAVCPNVCTKR